MLCCPVCDFDYTDVENVGVAARLEDEVTKHLVLNTATGALDHAESVPMGTRVGEGRRSRVALMCSCENGHRFAIVFTQHKGQTFVEIAVIQDVRGE
jgi:hypothetical protein